MSPTWIAILLTAAGCYALKLAGLSVPQRLLSHPRTVRAAELIPVALLGALIAVQVLGNDSAVVLDARVVGIGVAVVLLWLRVPFLPMVIAAAAATALVRLLF